MPLSPTPGNKVDVLIIGAGPAGLMAANALVHAGVTVRIVDKKTVPVTVGHADGIHPRTIEILQSYGLGERLQREGTRFDRAAFYNPGPNGGIKVIFVPSSSHKTNPSSREHSAPRQSSPPQRDTLSSSPDIKERPVVPTSIELSDSRSDLVNPDAYPVKVTLKNLDSEDGDEEVVQAKFAIGSDSAHSWTRKALNIGVEGDQTTSIWGVVDIVPDTDFPDIRNWTFIHSNQGTLMNIPREGDLIRFYIQLSSDTDFVNRETGRVDLTKASPDRIMEAAAKIMQPYRVVRVGDVEWWTVYIIGQRVAQTFSVKDRVFIAGDACHTHSPKAGQDSTIRSHPGLTMHSLEAIICPSWYESERLKYAQDLIDFDKKWSKMFSDKPQSEDNFEGVSHEEFLGMLASQSGFLSGIGIRYEPSTVVNNKHQACASKLIVGERVTPRDFVYAANVNPVNLHDVLPSDMRVKILVYAGDIKVEASMKRLHALGENMGTSNSFLWRFGQGAYEKVFDMLCICATKKDDMDFTDVPKFFRSHWSKVLLDDTDMYGRSGGGAYEAYGISREEGAIVVVRPDGYVGVVAPFDHVDDINQYFASFMLEAPEA
ncbi:thioredoxin-like protein [Dichomitus squalens LYAD-421 SS1]|uniref:Thioredoxin-like protein n=1 Tax=Dichomitus squalens (strain LYAD-421) TaxID=732165 RepID=R7SJE4_DICSQ|nr:thioredoxin-like protein [Dichomitus squalens LYAD-421 SS1]EJF56271.1 thioredoxin-like protein [Dichomitus squalens LYAD-421 SS1]